MANHYGALADVAVLDLAPGLKRTFAALPTTTPWLQQAMIVLKSVNDSIKSEVETESLSLASRCLKSLLIVWLHLTRKALKLLRRDRRRLETEQRDST